MLLKKNLFIIPHLSLIISYICPRKGCFPLKNRTAEIIPNEPDPGNAGVGSLVTFLAMCIPRASLLPLQFRLNNDAGAPLNYTL
jgi:hypothetical protein